MRPEGGLRVDLWSVVSVWNSGVFDKRIFEMKITKSSRDWYQEGCQRWVEN